MEIIIRFKTNRQIEEWWKIPPEKGKLRALVLYAAHALKHFLSFDSIVTEIFRSPGEQMEQMAAGNTPLSVGPHQDWRAADIRLNTLTEDQRKKMPEVVAHINAAWPRKDGKPSALAHGEGANFHLHLQLSKTEIS